MPRKHKMYCVFVKGGGVTFQGKELIDVQCRDEMKGKTKSLKPLKPCTQVDRCPSGFYTSDYCFHFYIYHWKWPIYKLAALCELVDLRMMGFKWLTTSHVKSPTLLWTGQGGGIYYIYVYKKEKEIPLDYCTRRFYFLCFFFKWLNIFRWFYLFVCFSFFKKKSNQARCNT